MKKAIFKDNAGNIHFGINSQEGFEKGEKEDIEKALKSIGKRKIWRCTVCNDLHIGSEPPKECPTCHVKNAYIEIDSAEFSKLLEIL